MIKIQNVNLNKMHIKKSKIIYLLRCFSRIYVKSIFKNPNKLENKPEIKRLKNLQTYIQNTYNIKQDILHVILYILNNISINNNGIIYICKEQVYTIKIEKIFKLITFGNLSVEKSAIFYDAIAYAFKQVRMFNYYGC